MCLCVCFYGVICGGACVWVCVCLSMWSLAYSLLDIGAELERTPWLTPPLYYHHSVQMFTYRTLEMCERWVCVATNFRPPSSEALLQPEGVHGVGPKVIDALLSPSIHDGLVNRGHVLHVDIQLPTKLPWNKHEHNTYMTIYLTVYMTTYLTLYITTYFTVLYTLPHTLLYTLHNTHTYIRQHFQRISIIVQFISPVILSSWNIHQSYPTCVGYPNGSEGNVSQLNWFAV